MQDMVTLLITLMCVCVYKECVLGAVGGGLERGFECVAKNIEG